MNFSTPFFHFSSIEVGALGMFLSFLVFVSWVVSFIMAFDCLRKPPDFKFGLTKSGEYDKVLWAVFILLTFSVFLGAFFYWWVIYREQGEVLHRRGLFPSEKSDEPPPHSPIGVNLKSSPTGEQRTGNRELGMGNQLTP